MARLHIYVVRNIILFAGLYLHKKGYKKDLREILFKHLAGGGTLPYLIDCARRDSSFVHP